MKSYISNCRLYNAPSKTVHIGIEEGKIVDLKADLADSDTILLDARGLITAPGLIDTHVHGAGGANPTDGKPESLHTMAKTLCRLGTTAFTATTFYFADSENEHLRMISTTPTSETEADCLGIHTEGPFINMIKKGGIQPQCVLAPDRETLSDLLVKTRGKLAIMTLAPEIEGNKDVIQICNEFGIIASFGHSYATGEEAKAGFDLNMRLVTHLNNAMRKYDKDKESPFEAIVDSGAFVQMITDGEHLSEQDINYFYQRIGGDRIVLITDGIESCGLPEGEYLFNGTKYRSEKGLAFYSDGSGKIGTSLSLFEIMMRFKRITHCTLDEAVNAASLNPAIVLGVADRKGRIKKAYDADLILMDANEKLAHVIKNGDLIL